MVMSSFSVCLSWKVSVSPSIMKDSFGGYSNLDFLSGFEKHDSVPSLLLEFLSRSLPSL
jgi:hypothetical protein